MCVVAMISDDQKVREVRAWITVHVQLTIEKISCWAVEVEAGYYFTTDVQKIEPSCDRAGMVQLTRCNRPRCDR